jgi:hypothetical protein
VSGATGEGAVIKLPPPGPIKFSTTWELAEVVETSSSGDYYLVQVRQARLNKDSLIKRVYNVIIHVSYGSWTPPDEKKNKKKQYQPHDAFFTETWKHIFWTFDVFFTLLTIVHGTQ